MSFINILVMLLALSFTIAGVLFIGHGLSAHGPWIAYGAGSLVVSAVLLAVAIRLMPDHEPDRHH